MLTLVAAVLAYDRVDRASETCERKSGRSGRSELRYAMSETSEEKDIVAACCREFREVRDVYGGWRGAVCGAGTKWSF